MTRRLPFLVLLALLFAPLRADAHVGSPDVFFEGDAGPYRLFVTVRVPQVIPGVATIEIRSEADDVQAIEVVPMRLTGPGSELPPTPDRADRSSSDPQFFTASLWLMERGSLQVRISVDGDRGPGTLAVPVPASAQRTLSMSAGLGGLLFALMSLLALALVAIAVAAVRESTLEPGVTPRARRRVLEVVVGAAVVGVIALGNAWWTSEAEVYARFTSKPWQVTTRVDGCRLRIAQVEATLLPDHGHLMHLFLVRLPDMDVLAHLHPERDDRGDYAQTLPSLPAGHYQLFADIVLDTGFPATGTGVIDLPDLTCGVPSGDDATWTGHGDATVSTLADGARMIWDRPASLRAGVATSLAFHVENTDGTPATLEPYMGMAGHAEIVRADATVFAHIHPSGTVAMPALELAQGGADGMADMPGMASSATPALAFPYGFPRPGDYRVFVQVEHAGQIVTGAFDAHVE